MTDTLIDRARCAAEISAATLDALVLFQPEHVIWATGINPGPAALFRRAGAASVVIPASADAPLAIVLPDLAAAWIGHAASGADIAYHSIWVDTATASPHGLDTPLSAVLSSIEAPKRPMTFDAAVAFGTLHDQLASRGLSNARLGLDLGFVPAADLALLSAALPSAVIVDATDVIRRIRMVKSSAEIARLRHAVELSEAGLIAALARVRKGVSRRELSQAYAHGVAAAASANGQDTPALWDYISIGPDPWGAGRPAEADDIIKFDVGVVIAGYSSDMARTICCGRPSRAARELHAALLSGLETGLAMLKPGVRLSAVYTEILNTVRGAGVPHYSRGHFGHSLGNDPFSEQWPFIAATCDIAAEPGMVLAMEVPHYVDGLGGFIIEDQLLITSDGIDIMSRHPRDLAIYR